MSGDFVLGIGGTTRASSTSERILQQVLARVEKNGTATVCISGPELLLPLYSPDVSDRTDLAVRLVSLMRECRGIVVASPGYHGSISGLVKNALDYAEDLSRDPLPYLSNKPFGCVTCAYGWQAANTTLGSLRMIGHALRAWPTPFGIAANAAELQEDPMPPALEDGINILAHQMTAQILL